MPTASKISETQNNPETFVDMPDEAIRDESSETTKNTKERLYLDENKKKGENILLSNNAIEITIDTVGGTIKRSKLLNYFESTDENSLNINLLDYEKEYYVAQSGLLHDKNSLKENKNKLAPNHHDVYEIVNKK